MTTKQVAVFFLYLFCFQYVLGMALAGRGVRGYPGQMGGGCRFSSGLKRRLNVCYVKAGEAPDYLKCPDQKNDEVELSKVRITEQKMGRGSFNCRCDGGATIIDMKVLYLRVLLSAVLNLLGDVLGGLLGGLGKSVVGLLGKVVDLLLKILCLDIVADVKLKVVPGAKCAVQDVRITNLTIKLLGLPIQLGTVLSKLLGPILLLLVKNILVENFLKRFIDCLGIVNSKEILRK